MRQVYVARDRSDAELARAFLARERIAAVVRADPMPVTRGPFPTVWVVKDEDAERAEALLVEFARGQGHSEG